MISFVVIRSASFGGPWLKKLEKPFPRFMVQCKSKAYLLIYLFEIYKQQFDTLVTILSSCLTLKDQYVLYVILHYSVLSLPNCSYLNFLFGFLIFESTLLCI